MSMPLACGAPVAGVDCGSTPCGCFQVAVAALGLFESGSSSTAPSAAVFRVRVMPAWRADASLPWNVGSVENV